MDMDQPPGDIYYTLQEGSHEILVFNESLRGIVLLEPFDPEGENSSDCMVTPTQFRVTVCDVNPPNENCPNIVFNVFFFPSNDNNPMFSETEYLSRVPESVAINTSLLTIMCTDEDVCTGEYGGMEIVDSENVFSIDSGGNITNLQTLDYERARFYMIRIRCFDMAQREAFTTVEIQVTDVNDNPPRCSAPELANLEVGSHQLTRVLTLSCTDGDEGINSELTFMVDGNLPQVPNGRFILSQTTGELNFTGELESNADFEFSINVSDSGPNPLTRTVGVMVRVTGEIVTTEVSVTEESATEVLPMLIIILVCVVGGFLLISCFIVICCCCLYFQCCRLKKGRENL